MHGGVPITGLGHHKVRDFILFISEWNTQDNVYLASVDFTLQWVVTLEGLSNEDTSVMETFRETID